MKGQQHQFPHQLTRTTAEKHNTDMACQLDQYFGTFNVVNQHIYSAKLDKFK